MKNLLLTVNSLYPERDRLSDILLQLTPYIADFDQKILSLDLSEEGTPPAKIDGVPVFFTKKRTEESVGRKFGNRDYTLFQNAFQNAKNTGANRCGNIYIHQAVCTVNRI